MARLTWQEVSAPDFGSSMRGLDAAFDSFDRGFQRAGDTIDKYDAAKTAAQSNDIMAKVLQLGSPEAAAAALASGQLTNGVDPRRINAAAFAAMRGRQDDLIKTEGDQIGLGQDRVRDTDFQDFNSAPVRALLNERARAVESGDQQAVDRIENDNRDVFNRLNQALLNGSTSSAQGLRQTGQSMRNTDTAYGNSEEDRLVQQEVDAAEDEAVIGGQGERGVAEGREAFIQGKIGQGMDERVARRIYSGLYRKFRGQGAAGSEFDAILGGPDEVGQEFGGGGNSGSTGAGGKDLADIVLGDGQGRGGGNAYGINPPKPISQMSMGELYDFQRNVMLPATRRAGVGKINGKVVGSSAVGAYQIVSTTLAKAAPVVLGADWKSKPFSIQNQEKIAQYLFDRTPVGGNLQKVWEGLPKGFTKTKGMSFAAVRDKITMAESGGRLGSGGARPIRDPGTDGVPVQSEVNRALTISTVANRYKISDSDTVQIARDWDKTWNSSANETEVAAGLVKGPMAGEKLPKVREALRYYMKETGISNPAVMGALLARAIGPEHDFLGRIDTWMGNNNGLSFNIDENKLWGTNRKGGLVGFAKDKNAMARTQLAVKDVDKSLQGNAAAEGLVAKIDAAYTAGLAKMKASGQDTSDYTARYRAARQRAGAFQQGAAAQSSRTGRDYSR